MSGRKDPLLKRSLARVHISRGDAARDRFDWSGARSAYSQALALTPGRADIWVQLGHAFKEGGDLDRAENAYRRAISLEPNVTDTHLQLGHLRKFKGDTEGAIASFESVLRLDPAMTSVMGELELLRRPRPKSDVELLAEAHAARLAAAERAVSELQMITDGQAWRLTALDQGVEKLRAALSEMRPQFDALGERMEALTARVQDNGDFGLELSSTRGSLAKAFAGLQTLEASLAALRDDVKEINLAGRTSASGAQSDRSLAHQAPPSDGGV